MKGRGIRRRWSIGFVDQVIWSGSNFVSSVIAARLLGIKSFGGYAFAMAVWMIALGLHRCLISDPLLIDNVDDVGRTDHAAGASLGASATLAILIALLGLFLRGIGSELYGASCLALSIWIAPLLWHDLARWVAYQRRTPLRALYADVVYLLVQGIALVILLLAGIRSMWAVMATWGLGATTAAAFGFFSQRIRPKLGRSGFYRKNWAVSRWLLLDFIGYYSAGQLYLFVISWSVGPAGLGAVRAAQQLLGPVAIMIAAIQSFGLKEVAIAADVNRERLPALVRTLSMVSLGFALAYSVMAVLLSAFLVERVYGHGFSQASSLVVLASVQWVIMSIGVGPSLAIKATKATKHLIAPRLAGTLLSSVVALILSRSFGLVGAAGSGVISALTTVSVLYGAYRTSVRRPGAQHNLVVSPADSRSPASVA